MKMEKRTFRIGELTRVLSQKGLNIEPSVIRFWEKEFNIRPKRSDKGQRYYDGEDLEKFVKIRDLLYGKRFTIEGARQALNGERIICKPAVPLTQSSSNDSIAFQLIQLRERLHKLKKLL